ncbi:receptor-like protein 2 [Pistacia vera]|uniref:receptor-like protein 2 n=1 Tax=Pistacia vera TaxID=55513 RepID=UPI001263B088|nr:receptor-like protein 2 [Pistacia vera]
MFDLSGNNFKERFHHRSSSYQQEIWRVLMSAKIVSQVLSLPLAGQNFLHSQDSGFLNNDFTGPIPPGLGNCSRLQVSGQPGQVPSWISNLRKLQFLDLSLNQITGSIPGWLGTMTTPFYTDLSYNLLSGEFPKELGGLPMLVSELQTAKKIGGSRLELPLSIPPNINASNEEYYSLLSLPPSIFLQNNSLSGSIPIEIGQLQFLQLLNLSNNKFSGNIPNQISQLTNLERLDISRNNLSGEIPASFSGLYFLSEFSVANNNLQGLIPSGGQFHTFSISNFEGNPGLCGDIIETSCSIQTRTNNNPVPSPSESSKKELVYGLTAGVVFGFIIGSIGGIFCPIRVYSLFRTL